MRVMSSYAKYCRDQAADCERRAKIAAAPEVAASCRILQERWLKLAQKADAEGRHTADPEAQPNPSRQRLRFPGPRTVTRILRRILLEKPVISSNRAVAGTRG
jgi:hypothetical protein